jgi:DNA polymerase-1
MVVPLALKIPVSEVTDKHKKYGKICNFAWLYGASDKKIAETLSVDEKTAKKCRTKVFSYFNATGKFIERTHAIAAKQGYIRTVFRGESARFRLLFDFGSKNRSQVGSAKRKSFNTVVQGSANDVCLQALVKVDRYFQERPELGRVVLSIHDALLFEVPTHLASSVLEDICRMMTEDVGFPVDVEAEWGPNWSEQSVWKPGDAPTWDQPEPTPTLKPKQTTSHTKNQPTIH